jgi:hypothetical protein
LISLNPGITMEKRRKLRLNGNDPIEYAEFSSGK